MLLDSLVNHPRFAARESDYIRWYPKSLTPFTGAAFAVAPRPNGIYIHVPFCDRLCRFCPFNKQATEKSDVDRFVRALLLEIDAYAAMCQSPGIEFIYFGGGSPSALPAKVLGQIVERIGARFPLRAGLEICAECHPTHLDKDYCGELKRQGFTRISTGIQSFDQAALERMGAQHAVADVHRAIESVGYVFGSVAIDLLFRCPGQSVDQWLAQLQQACGHAAVDHLSLYSLIAKDPATQPPPEIEAEMTVLAHEFLVDRGFHHYASCASGGFDFSKPGRHSVYEERHWGAPQAEFLGLGPGALGFVSGCTTVNGLGLDDYALNLESGRLAVVSATGTDREEAMRRYFVLGVKTLEVPLAPFRQTFGVDPQQQFAGEFAELGDLGFAEVADDWLRLSARGRLFVDSVSSVFFSASEADVPHPEEPQIRRVEVSLKRARVRMAGTAA